MAMTKWFVDPSIDADSGAGTKASPYGDLQYAFDEVGTSPGRNSTDGDKFNIKAGTDESLSGGALSLATYGEFLSLEAPLVLQGYTTDEDDGGIGGINCGGSNAMWTSVNYDYVHHVDLHIHNGSSAGLVNLNNNIQMVRCELNNTTGNGMWADGTAEVRGCYLHDIGGIGIRAGFANQIEENYLKTGTKSFTVAISAGSGTIQCRRNVINIQSSGSTDGITTLWDTPFIHHNSIYSNGGTGQGIHIISGSEGAALMNNVIAGFSGTGGIGIDIDDKVWNYGGNHVYDCATNYSIAADKIVNDYGDNEDRASGGSPFTDPDADNFKPVDIGNMKEGALFQSFLGSSTDQRKWKGAVEPTAPAGGNGVPLFGPRMKVIA